MERVLKYPILLKIPNDSSRLIVVILTFTDTCLYLYKKKNIFFAYWVIRKRKLNVHILMLMIKLRFLLIGSTHLLSLGWKCYSIFNIQYWFIKLNYTTWIRFHVSRVGTWFPETLYVFPQNIIIEYGNICILVQ